MHSCSRWSRPASKLRNAAAHIECPAATGDRSGAVLVLQGSQPVQRVVGERAGGHFRCLLRAAIGRIAEAPQPQSGIAFRDRRPTITALAVRAEAGCWLLPALRRAVRVGGRRSFIAFVSCCLRSFYRSRFCSFGRLEFLHQTDAVVAVHELRQVAGGVVGGGTGIVEAVMLAASCRAFSNSLNNDTISLVFPASGFSD